MIKRLLFVSIFILLVVKGNCIAPTTKNYSGASEVIGMTCDDENLWIATKGGLQKFNIANRTTTYYDCSNSELLSNNIECIYEDSLKNVYIGLAQDGLAIFDGEHWQYIDSFSTGEKIIGVSSISGDGNGGLYVRAVGSGQSGGLAHFTNGQLSIILPGTQFGWYGLTTTPDGSVWSGSPYGLTRYDGQTLSVFDTSNSDFPLNTIYVIGSDDSGRVWLHMNSVLGRTCTFDGVNIVFYPDNITRDAANARSMYQNRNNNHLYFYSANCNGLNEFDGTNWIYTPNVSGTNDLVAICFDRANNFYSCINYGHDCALKIDNTGIISKYTLNRYDFDWYGGKSVKIGNGNKKYFSSGSEIYESDGLTVRTLNAPADLGAIADAKLYTDHLDRIWVIDDYIEGGQTLNVSVYNGTYWESIPIIAKNCAEDKFGRMWFTGVGLHMYDGGVIQDIGSTIAGLPNPPNFDAITFDNSGNVWFSNYSSLMKYNGVNLISFTSFNSPLDYSVGSVGSDLYGNIWTNSKSGFCKWDGGSWTDYDSTYFGNRKNVFYKMANDRNGESWFATYQGLVHFDGTNFTTFDKNTSRFGDDYIMDLDVDEFNNVWVSTVYCGFSVFNPGGLSSVAMLEKKPTAIEGTVFHDANQNGVRDSLEFPYMYQPVSIYPDSITHFTNAEGKYRFDVDEGNHVLTSEANADWFLTTDSSSFNLSVDTADLCCYDFGLNSLLINEAIDVDLSSTSNRCFFPNTLVVHLENTGTVAFNTYVVLKLDSAYSLNSVVPPPYSLSADSVVWKVNNLIPSMSLSFSANVTNTTTIGDTLLSTVDVYNQANNDLLSADTLIQIITCSYDPNDKACQPAGIDTAHYTLTNEWLEYTIRFENSGNDTAFNIVIRDTLNSHLDPTSFRMISSDKQVEASISSAGALQFIFPNVYLPYLAIDTLGSQGYVKYKVKAYSTTPDPTRVTNEAHIFFDFNPPIKTNTTWNTLTRTLPTIGVNEIPSTHTMQVYPNPFTGQTKVIIAEKSSGSYFVNLMDVTGKVVEKIKVDSNEFIFEAKKNYHGVFFLEVRDRSGIIIGHTKLVIL